MFSSKSFTVSSLTFKSPIPFEFIFVYGIHKCSNFILLHVAVQFSQHHSLKRLYLFSIVYYCLLVKDKVSIDAQVYLWAFYLASLVCISVFVPLSYCLDDCSFKVKKLDSSSSVFLSQDCFGSSGSSVFPYKL